MVGATLLGLAFTVRSGDVRWLFLSLPLALMLFFVGRLAPTGYRLVGEGVHIERRAGPALVPYRSIRSVDRRPRALGGLSLTASKGVFGRFGQFWNPTLGFYRLYVTNSDSVVWLETVNGWIGLSPDRPQEFVERLAARLGRRSG